MSDWPWQACLHKGPHSSSWAYYFAQLSYLYVCFTHPLSHGASMSLLSLSQYVSCNCKHTCKAETMSPATCAASRALRILSLTNDAATWWLLAELTDPKPILNKLLAPPTFAVLHNSKEYSTPSMICLRGQQGSSAHSSRWLLRPYGHILLPNNSNRDQDLQSCQLAAVSIQRHHEGHLCADATHIMCSAWALPGPYLAN